MVHGILKRIYRSLWSLRYVFPINSKKIVVVSYYGKGFSDNPKYIVNKLTEIRPDLKIYWAIKKKGYRASLPSNITPIKYKSVAYVYHMITAKVWLDNARKPQYEQKKASQIYIQAWHGSNAIIKKVEKDAQTKLSKEYINSAKNDAAQTDLMIAGSSFGKDKYRESFWYPDGEILSAGSPRNDVFFNNTEVIKDKVYKKFNLDKDIKFVLYAPTFKENHSIDANLLDFKKITDSLETRFGGKWILAIRLHPNIENGLANSNIGALDCIIDATNYDDMQELLVASSAMITDYSSSVFDYMLTKRPIFICAPDYEEYVAERGVYFDMRSLPFPYSDTEKSLCDSIVRFNEIEFDNMCTDFMKSIEVYDNGTASITVAQWIVDKLSL